MAAFEHHVFVCGNRREPGHSRGSCDPEGADRLRAAFKAEIEKRGLKPRVRANGCGCLDQCELGPTVVIYPRGVWYGRVRIEDVPRIIERTIVGGEVVEDLAIPDSLLNTKRGWPAS